MRTLSLALALTAALLQPAAGYWNYDPQAPPNGGPHRKLNELAWQLFVTMKVREAEQPDPVLSRYKLKDADLRPLTGETVTTWGAWADNLAMGPASLTLAGWIAEGGYTADEPELFMALRHFYDPTQPEGQRYLTDIPWIGKFREQVRSHWRRDVETVNPNIDARAWALDRADNAHGWAQGLAAMRLALGPGEATQAQRERYAADAWRCLGETMHLLADMTVAAHVRNDGHPGNLPFGELRPDPYEDLILAPEIEAAYRTIPRTPNLQRLDPFMAMDDEIGDAISGASTPHALFQAVAVWVNRHFLTPDTLAGKDRRGLTLTAINGHSYPRPALGADCAWDEGSGTYDKSFARRADVQMVKETWQQGTFASWLANVGLNLSGGTLTFSTSKDCVVSQAQVLVPIALAANMRLIDWFVPRLRTTITAIDATRPDKPLTGKVEHLKYGAWQAPIEVTLPKGAPIELYVDGLRQDPRHYELTVTKGVLAGKLTDVPRLPEAKKIWVEFDVAGVRAVSDEFSPQGQLYVRVCKPKDQVQVGPRDLYGTLNGVPIAGAPVTVTWTRAGKAESLQAQTDKNGVCRFAAPLGVEVTVRAQGETKTARCTPDKPNQAVTFGWQGHDPTK